MECSLKQYNINKAKDLSGSVVIVCMLNENLRMH